MGWVDPWSHKRGAMCCRAPSARGGVGREHLCGRTRRRALPALGDSNPNEQMSAASWNFFVNPHLALRFPPRRLPPLLPPQMVTHTATGASGTVTGGACGVRIVRVLPSSPAETAGLKPGDVVARHPTPPYPPRPLVWHAQTALVLTIGCNCGNVISEVLVLHACACTLTVPPSRPVAQTKVQGVDVRTARQLQAVVEVSCPSRIQAPQHLPLQTRTASPHSRLPYRLFPCRLQQSTIGQAFTLEVQRGGDSFSFEVRLVLQRRACSPFPVSVGRCRKQGSALALRVCCVTCKSSDVAIDHRHHRPSLGT